VMADGELRQLGRLPELLERPADAFVARLTGANVLPGLVGDGEAVVAHPWELSLAAERPEGALAVPGTVHGVVPEGDRVRVRVGEVVVLVARGELERLGLGRGAPAWAVLPPGPPRVVAR
jgi:ABC-type sulfate/molybdate transport systems ATPase subunit